MLQTNQNSGTFGVEFLIGAMLAFAVAIFVRGDIQRLKSVRITTFFLSTFLSYTIAKYYLEADAEHRFNKLPVEPQDLSLIHI